MTTFENEEILLTSDDKSITLTNQRVIYKTSEVSQEILLKDVVGHEIILKKEKFFLGSGIATVIVIYFVFKSFTHLTQAQHSPHYSFLILIILAVVFFYYYNFRPKKLLKISGRFNSIEFSIKNLSQDGLNTFLNRLSIESENRKKEK